MTSLYRDLNDAALEANLNKTQLLVFLALSNQTLGYGKITDPLTDKRIAQLTGIRLDRLRPAIRAIVKTGLFDCHDHDKYDHQYSIGKKFLEAHQGKVYTPFIPKNGSPSENKNPMSRNDADSTQNGKNQPEKKTHTVIQPTKSNLQQPQTKKTTLSNPQQQTQSVKILFTHTEQGNTPPSFAIETSMANTRVEVAFDTPKTATNAPLTTEPDALTTPETIATLKKLLAISKIHNDTSTVAQVAKKTEKTAIDTDIGTDTESLTPITVTATKTTIDNAIASSEKTAEPLPPSTETTAVCGGDEKVVKKTATTSPLTLPKAISEDDAKACHNHFKTLSREQQQKVLQVFDYNFKTRTINNTAGYFITLVRATKEDGLTVPSESFVTAPRSEKKKAEEAEKLNRIELWSEYTWLQGHAEREKIAIDVLAKQMGEKTEAAYAMFRHVQ